MTLLALKWLMVFIVYEADMDTVVVNAATHWSFDTEEQCEAEFKELFSYYVKGDPRIQLRPYEPNHLNGFCYQSPDNQN